MHLRKSRLGRSARLASVWISTFTSAFAAATASGDSGASSEPIALDPLTVIDSRGATKLPLVDERWLYGRIGEFEVLSNASERDTQDYMKRLYSFHLLFRELFPQMNVAKRRPATLVLCGNHDAFRTIQPKQPTDDRNQTASFYASDANSALIGLDLQQRDYVAETGVDLSRNVSGALLNDEEATADRIEIDADLQVKREYVHFVLSQSGSHAPAWLEEGLAQLLAIAEIENGTLRFGRLKWNLVGAATAIGDSNISSMGSSEKADELALFFNKRGLIPLGEFLSTSSDSEEARNAIGGRFAMQALAFLHFSLYADNGQRQGAFMQFVSKLATQPPSEALFESCFGRSYSEYQRDLRGYLQGGSRYRTALAKNFSLPPLPELTLRTALPAEWLRVKADAQRISGRTADAALTLQVALENKYTDARLFASVGFLQLQRDNRPEALRAFRHAVDAKVELPAPYLELALEKLHTSGDGRVSTLTNADFVAVMRLLMTAREKMSSPRRELYEAIAATWQRAPVNPQNNNLAVLEEGVLAFPSDVALVADTAELKKRIGRREDAYQLAQLGLRVATDAPTKARFNALANETKSTGSSAPH